MNSKAYQKEDLHTAYNDGVNEGMTSSSAFEWGTRRKDISFDEWFKDFEPAAPLPPTTEEVSPEEGKGELYNKEQLILFFNNGYMRGHHDTVEAQFTDIHHSDMNSYHEDIVDDILAEQIPTPEQACNLSQQGEQC